MSQGEELLASAGSETFQYLVTLFLMDPSTVFFYDLTTPSLFYEWLGYSMLLLGFDFLFYRLTRLTSDNYHHVTRRVRPFEFDRPVDHIERLEELYYTTCSPNRKLGAHLLRTRSQK